MRLNGAPAHRCVGFSGGGGGSIFKINKAVKAVFYAFNHRTSVSKYAVNTVNLEAAPMPSSIFPTINPTYRNLSRPRQNSVFTEPKTFPAVENPRKVKSAMDIQSLILNEMTPYRGSRSMIPIGDRRTSCFGNFVSPSHDRRPSCCLYPPVTEFRRHSGDLLCYKDRPHLAPNFVPVAARRPSCCVGVGDYFPTRKMSCVGGDNILPTTAGVTSSLLKSPIADAAKKEREKERERWDGPSTSTAGPSGTRKTSVSADLLAPLKSLTKDRRTSFNNVLAQVTSERRASSSILRLASNVSNV
ncbi:unnamed protein product [Bemisia tabaci]|uniref:Fibronectin type III domain-containing protein n=1 Tax=Bemisia tabaci TaxID=7038 RepID=A0A9P0A622_BEMTA|nr:unnamed protein product [Bemisia tabaci]